MQKNGMEDWVTTGILSRGKYLSKDTEVGMNIAYLRKIEGHVNGVSC